MKTKQKVIYIIGGALLLWGFSMMQHYLFFGSINQHFTSKLTLTSILLSVIVSPTIEELFFRNFLIKFICDFNIRRRYALIISSILFMLAHCMNHGFIYYSIAYFIGGLIFGIVHIKCQDNYSSILCHSLYNLCVIVPILI